jgi:UDP-4-amino-4,6-dideoxy-N-acetyl-beta-L-altrosamine N-acetyltransferase
MKKRQITLQKILEISKDDQLALRKLRNKKDCRKWMYSDHIISIDEHFQWIENQKTDKSLIVFAVYESKEVIGMFKINNISWRHKTCDWGYYIDSSYAGTGIGQSLEYTTVDFIFNTLNLIKQTVEVMEGNNLVLRLHNKFLFKEEGFRKSAIIKDGKRCSFHELSVLRRDWNAGKAEVKKLVKSFKFFNVKIVWK